MAEQQIPNYARTTLRAPVTVSDTQLLLASGGGSFFNFPAGNWCYLTVNDSTTFEIMKYTSSGTVVGDIITVERAQDGSTAKAFPAGACVTVGWNTDQVRQFILQTAGSATSTNTQVLSNPEDEPPTLPPPDGIIYTVNVATGQSWFWDGTSWILLRSNSIVEVATTPSGPPVAGVKWAVNLSDGSLYYWDGGAWIPIAGSSGSGLIEILSRVRLISPPVTYNPGAYTFATSGLMSSATTVIDYHTNPATPTNITIPTSGANDQRIVFTHACIAEFDVGINGIVSDSTLNAKADLVLTHTGGSTAYGSTMIFPNTSSDTSIDVSVHSGPVAAVAGDAWDMNFIVNAGVGATYSTIQVDQFYATVKVIALL